MYRLESLDVWKVANSLARSAYRLAMAPPLKGHFALADQIRRASISIPANLAEGYGLSTKSQLVRCLRISLGSAYELRCHLELASDLELVRGEDLQPVQSECLRAIQLLVGTLRGLRATRRHP